MIRSSSNALIVPPRCSLAAAAVLLLSSAGTAPAADCNQNQVDDRADIAAGTSADYAQFPPDPAGWNAPSLRSFRADPELGLAFLGIVGAYWHDGFDIPPGEDVLVVSLRASVSPDVAPGTLVRIEPTNGPDGNGAGPHLLRNELVHRGDARFVSVLPKTEGALLQIVGDQSYFIRGDSNGDWAVDISDPVTTLNSLFLGGPAIACADAADSNDDGAADISDAVHTLRFLFDGAEPIAPPFPAPGLDPTADGLRCLRLPRP